VSDFDLFHACSWWFDGLLRAGEELQVAGGGARQQLVAGGDDGGWQK